MHQNPMSPERGAVVLAAWDGKKLTGDSAKRVITKWLDAQPELRRDTYGNYLPADRSYRWHFTKQMLQRQRKSSYGDWQVMKSQTFVEAAQNLLVNAAKAVGDEAALAKLTKAREARKGAAEKRRSKEAGRRLEEQAGGWAMKIVAQRFPEDFVAMMQRQISEDRAAALKAEAARYFREVLAQLQAGGHMADGEIVSADDPPLAAFFDKTVSYQWTETMGGVVYTVAVKPSSHADIVEVHIGKPSAEGFMGRVDPFGVQVRHYDWEGAMAEGDAYISGWVKREPGKAPYGVLLFISSHDKQRGAGTRVLDLWCRMMRVRVVLGSKENELLDGSRAEAARPH